MAESDEQVGKRILDNYQRRHQQSEYALQIEFIGRTESCYTDAVLYSKPRDIATWSSKASLDNQSSTIFSGNQ